FEKVVETLNVPRDLSRAPVFQVMFTLQNTGLPEFVLPGVTVEMLPLQAASAKFELTLEMSPSLGNGYHARWEFNRDLFDAATIERLAVAFETLLSGASRAPDTRICKLPLLTEANLQQLLHDWNDTLQPYDEEMCLHTLFEHQVERTPDAVALVCGAETLSYRALNARAEQLARRLRQHGVGPERCVGICLARSADLVAALLGTLKAGGVYVPMDPAYPRERLLYMLDDAACQVVVTTQGNAALFAGQAVPMLLLDADTPKVTDEVAAASPCASNTAYVIYTSGSTGQPKGVQIAHRSVVNFLTSMAAQPGLNATDTLLAVTSVSFDIAALELFLPLVQGARLVLAEQADTTDGHRLLALAQQHGATVIQATPSTYWLMLASAWPAAWAPKALCGGEALPAALIQALLPRVSSLWNMYGPTETTIWSSTRRVNAVSTSIGRPIANTVLRILDDSGQPCPIGVAGELYIGGDGVATGYLNRPGLTAERFVADPWGKAGARLYRTGDQVRWLADGEIEYLGRLDHQVKVRGFRIELGEIENRLTEHPQVDQAVAIVREEVPGERRIVAYYIAHEELATAALRGHLAGSLPDYMVPGAFQRLAQWPLTPNGKVDRKALTGLAVQVEPRHYLAPQSKTEHLIAGLWQSMLGLERVGLADNFFELGGHSLLAAQLVDRLRREHGLKLTLKDLFETGSLGALAERAQNGTPDSTSLAVTLRHGTAQHIFLVHAIGGSAAAYLALAQAIPTNCSIVAFQSAGLESDAAPQDHVADMAERYIEEMLAIQPAGPYRLGGWSMGGLVAFEMACQLEARGHSVESLVLLDTLPPGTGAVESPSSWPLGDYLADIASISGLPLPLDADAIASLQTNPGRDEIAIAAARQAGLLPDTLRDTLLARRLAVFEANQRAMLRYRPTHRFGGDLTVLHAATSVATQVDGWRTRIAGSLTTATVPGNHYSMLLAAGPMLHLATAEHPAGVAQLLTTPTTNI
uniref:non-ribosomal peptide synthetase n=1 Tax=Chitinolyticbacter albus TaxID=2961951 RepID=UPI0021093EF1